MIYNAIRDIMMQREQALKTYLSEVFQKEESLCLQKLEQIEVAVAEMNQFDSELTKAAEESDIELLRKFQERK